MNTLNQQKQLMLNYPIEKIKEAIISICSLDRYMLEENNELTNSYKIIVSEGFDTGVINNHLINIDENKTAYIIEVNNVEDGNVTIDRLISFQENYIKLLTDKLDGKVIIKKRKPEGYFKKNISYKTFLIIVFIIAALVFFALKKILAD